MKNKKEKVNIEELFNIIQEQNKTIRDLKDAIVFIEENCIDETKISVQIACLYDNDSSDLKSLLPIRKDYLQIKYLKSGKIQILKYKLPEYDSCESFPKIIEVSQDIEKNTYIITLEFGEEYKYYMANTENKDITDVTNLIKFQSNKR